jgi:hypothetical protein
MSFQMPKPDFALVTLSVGQTQQRALPRHQRCHSAALRCNRANIACDFIAMPVSGGRF